MSDLPEWVVPGARVAVTEKHLRPGAPLSIKYLTVDRVLKRDIVLSDGQRFRHDLERREGGTWGWTMGMFRVDDPIVAQRRAEIDRSRRRTRARLEMDRFDQALRGLRDGVEDRPDSTSVIQALAHYIADSKVRAAVEAALPAEGETAAPLEEEG